MDYTPVENLPFPRGLGYRQDSPDRRDRVLFRAPVNIDALPNYATCHSLLPAVMDQQQTGSCTGFGNAAMLYDVMKKDGHRKPFVPSPVFLYREARVLGGYVDEDCGAENRNVLKVAAKLGLPPMSNLKPRFKPTDLAHPYTGIFPPNSIWRRPATASVYADAERRQALNYFRLEGLGDILQSIADGWPVSLGFNVWYSFYNKQTGNPHYNVPEVQPNDYILGGHLVCAYAYDRPSRKVFFRNSWGETAHEGKPDFTLSFPFMEREVRDAWTVRFIEGGKKPKAQ